MRHSASWRRVPSGSAKAVRANAARRQSPHQRPRRAKLQATPRRPKSPPTGRQPPKSPPRDQQRGQPQPPASPPKRTPQLRPSRPWQQSPYRRPSVPKPPNELSNDQFHDATGKTAREPLSVECVLQSVKAHQQHQPTIRVVQARGRSRKPGVAIDIRGSKVPDAPLVRDMTNSRLALHSRMII